jgi:hypothetical protein
MPSFLILYNGRDDKNADGAVSSPSCPSRCQRRSTRSCHSVAKGSGGGGDREESQAPRLLNFNVDHNK